MCLFMSTVFCLDSLFVCDVVRSDYVIAVVAVCTAYCALQSVLFTLHCCVGASQFIVAYRLRNDLYCVEWDVKP